MRYFNPGTATKVLRLLLDNILVPEPLGNHEQPTFAIAQAALAKAKAATEGGKQDEWAYSALRSRLNLTDREIHALLTHWGFISSHNDPITDGDRVETAMRALRAKHMHPDQAAHVIHSVADLRASTKKRAVAEMYARHDKRPRH